MSSSTTRKPIRLCTWCGRRLSRDAKAFAKFCGRKCRQSAFRLRHRRELVAGIPATLEPKRFRYADPPYPGFASYYADHPDYGGEVDHPALIASMHASLTAGEIHGYALSTSGAACFDLLELFRGKGATLHPWVKPIGVSSNTQGPHNTWEALIVVGGRRVRPGVRDWLRAHPARGGGDLIGRKPVAFCAWLFDLLGMVPGDELDDLFPGTGIVGRSWRALSSLAAAPDPSSSAGVRRQVLASLVDERLEASLGDRATTAVVPLQERRIP